MRIGAIPQTQRRAATGHVRAGILAAPRRTWPYVLAASSVLALQVLLAAASIAILSALRAYIGGESMYSKGRTTAQIALRDYLNSREEVDFERFSAALSVPLGDARAREALLRSPPDLAAAREGFLAGGNDPGDISGLIWLFRWFNSTPLLKPALELWRRGDEGIKELQGLGKLAEGQIRLDANAEALAQLRVAASEIDKRLTRLEAEFSLQLGKASRAVGFLLLLMNVASGLVLGSVFITILRHRLIERANAEREVARLLDSIGDAVVSLDISRRIVLFNRAAEAIFGFSASDRLGTEVAELVEPANYSKLLALIDSAMPANEAESVSPAVHDIRARRFDGTTFPAEVSTSVVRTRSGPVTTIVLRDITNQEQARAERQARVALETSNRAKSAFLSSMSHELRTPLNAVIGFARIILMDKNSQIREGDRRRIQHIEQAGAHLLALVNDILDLSRIEAGQMIVSLEATDATAVAERALTMTAQAAREAGIDLEPLIIGANDSNEHGTANSRTRLHHVLADALRLQQVFINLLSNAVKYTPAGGQVVMSISDKGGRVEIAVSDTGRGMSREQLNHLFEPFNRLGAEHSQVEGTGIGLVLTKQLVTLMNGHLEVESAQGIGTRVSVCLPTAADPVAPLPENPASATPIVEPCEPLDVIYVEDNEVNIEIMRQILQLRCEVTLRVAMSGSEAVKMVGLRPPQLMLIDLHLGDMSGLELAVRLRSDTTSASIPLVAVSADALPDQIDQALKGGFDAYITKPVDPEQIISAVVALGGHGRLS